MEPISCPHCSAANDADSRFCESCGKALPDPHPAEPRVVTDSELARSTTGQQVQSEALRTQARKAAAALLAVAILQAVAGTFVLFALQGEIAGDPDLEIDAVVIASVYGIGVLFFGLYLWARRNPLPACDRGPGDLPHAPPARCRHGSGLDRSRHRGQGHRRDRPGEGHPGRRPSSSIAAGDGRRRRMSADGNEAGAAPPGGRTSRFCRHCGAELDSTIDRCRACDGARQETRAEELEPTASKTLFGSSLALYFALLSTGLVSLLTEWDELQSLLMVSAADTALVLAWLVFCRRAVADGLTSVPSPRWFVVAGCLSVLTFLLSTVGVTAMTAMLGAEEYSYTAPFLEAGYGPAWVILVICVQPAVVEEIAFRGVILSGMQRFLDVNESVLVSSLLFMTIHVSVISFPHLLLIGIVLGYLRARTGSLYPGMFLHFTHNFLCVLSEYTGVG